jgi:hypothetical protein
VCVCCCNIQLLTDYLTVARDCFVIVIIGGK